MDYRSRRVGNSNRASLFRNVSKVALHDGLGKIENATRNSWICRLCSCEQILIFNSARSQLLFWLGTLAVIQVLAKRFSILPGAMTHG
jgi:hypothetical protein